MSGVASTSEQQARLENARYAYDKLLQCRDLELELHVGRSNLCLVIEAALVAVVAPAILGKETGPILSDWIAAVLVSLFGLGLSLVCVRIVQGSDFWISYWEHRLAKLEAEALDDLEVFRGHPSKYDRRTLEAVPKHLRYVSSRRAILRLFVILAGVWFLLTAYSTMGLLAELGFDVFNLAK